MTKSIYRALVEHTSLETERLLLRPVRMEDASDMYQYASDEETVRWTFERNRTLEETKESLAQIYLASPLGRWGIVKKGENRLIGTIDLQNIDQQMKKAELGYILHKGYWNQGLMTEAVSAIIALCFESLELNVIRAQFDKENPASGRVMEKAGMVFSHEEPYARLAKQGTENFVTMCHYRLTKEEYRQRHQ